MRITNRMLHDATLTNLSRNVEAMAKAQERLSTGRRLNRPSDNPADVRSAVNLRDGLAELRQYERNIDVAERTLTASEVALAAAGEIVQRARELAIQGANGTLSADDRTKIAIEVEQLLAGLLERAGAQTAGSYLFSGHRTDTAPYATPTGAYQGDGGAIEARIGPWERVQINVTADATFGPALAALETMRAELAGGLPVSTATIVDLDAGQDALIVGRAQIGAVQNRLAETRVFIGDQIVAAQRLQSQLEDADMAEVITDLSQREATYQAALAASARILRRSLFDEI